MLNIKCVKCGNEASACPDASRIEVVQGTGFIFNEQYNANEGFNCECGTPAIWHYDDELEDTLSEFCKANGLKRVDDLLNRTGLSRQTLQNWQKSKSKIMTVRLLIRTTVMLQNL